MAIFKTCIFLPLIRALTLQYAYSFTTRSILLKPVKLGTEIVNINKYNENYGDKKQMHLSMVGNFLSGVTGIPPSTLNPPYDLLKGTSIDPDKDNVDLKCVYKASRDGWSAVDFHRCCDERGSGLVVILSQTGKKFGGFNPLGWMSSDDYGGSNSAFLFFEMGKLTKKCPILSGGNAAIFDYATGGPQFGSADLVIGTPKAAVMGGFSGPDMQDTSINAGTLRQGTSSIGGAYEFVKGWPVGGNFRITEVEVYCNGNISPITSNSFWPF